MTALPEEMKMTAAKTLRSRIASWSAWYAAGALGPKRGRPRPNGAPFDVV